MKADAQIPVVSETCASGPLGNAALYAQVLVQSTEVMSTTHAMAESPPLVSALFAVVREPVPLERIILKRKAGRPRKIERRPTAHEQDYYAVISASLSEWERWGISDVLGDGSDPVAVLRGTMIGLAREQAALHFDRITAARKGADFQATCSRRVDALARLGSLAVTIHNLGVDLDGGGEALAKVRDLWIGTVRAVAADTLTDPQRFMDLLVARMDGTAEGSPPHPP